MSKTALPIEYGDMSGYRLLKFKRDLRLTKNDQYFNSTSKEWINFAGGRWINGEVAVRRPIKPRKKPEGFGVKPQWTRVYPQDRYFEKNGYLGLDTGVWVNRNKSIYHVAKTPTGYFIAKGAKNLPKGCTHWSHIENSALEKVKKEVCKQRKTAAPAKPEVKVESKPVASPWTKINEKIPPSYTSQGGLYFRYKENWHNRCCTYFICETPSGYFTAEYSKGLELPEDCIGWSHCNKDEYKRWASNQPKEPAPQEDNTKSKNYEQYQQNVKAGAEFLDKEKPGWFTLIDLAKLNMMKGSSCISGQLKLNRMLDKGKGFIPYNIDEEGELRQIWIALIEQRRKEAALATLPPIELLEAKPSLPQEPQAWTPTPGEACYLGKKKVFFAGKSLVNNTGDNKDYGIYQEPDFWSPYLAEMKEFTKEPYESVYIMDKKYKVNFVDGKPCGLEELK